MLQVTGLSVWRIEPGNPQPTGFGVMGPDDLMANADAARLCAELITKLWNKNEDRNDTRIHVFDRSAEKAEYASEVKATLWEIAHGMNFRRGSEKVAQWLSTSRWSQRYVLLIMSFERDRHRFAALILTESAKDETFLITRDSLVRELEDIFKRVIYKGVLYPYFDSVAEDVDDDRAKVYQASAALYILDRLGLVPDVTPSQMLGEALRQVSDNPPALDDLTEVPEILVEAAAATRQEEPDAVAPLLESAPLNVHVDSIRLKASFGDWLSGRITFDGGPGQYTIVIRGSNVNIKSGNRTIAIHTLMKER